MTEIQLFILTDDDGNCIADTDNDTACERWNDDIGGHPSRAMSITLRIPKSQEVTITIPESQAGVSL